MIDSGDGGIQARGRAVRGRRARRAARAAAAAELLDAGDDRGAAELSAAALERYRGDLLHGAGDWAAPYRARLDEARMELIETQFAARLRLGGAGDLIGELESAVATYPYQEGLWELLITALYRAGRQADALATYQRVRALLADELGLAPGPRLQELERRILVHDSALGIGDVQRERSKTTPKPGTCRRSSAELVGRETEIAALVGPARRATGWSRSSGRAGSGRRPSRSPPVAGWLAEPRQAGSGWPGSRPRRPPTTSSTR